MGTCVGTQTERIILGNIKQANSDIVQLLAY
jgi:hypothetical protein